MEKKGKKIKSKKNQNTNKKNLMKQKRAKMKNIYLLKKLVVNMYVKLPTPNLQHPHRGIVPK